MWRLKRRRGSDPGNLLPLLDRNLPSLIRIMKVEMKKTIKPRAVMKKKVLVNWKGAIEVVAVKYLVYRKIGMTMMVRRMRRCTGLRQITRISTRV